MIDDDDSTTPPRGTKLRAITDSERQRFAMSGWKSGVPVVRDPDEPPEEDTSPIDLFDRGWSDVGRQIAARLRKKPTEIPEFIGEFAMWVRERLSGNTSENRAAVEELRQLLSKPPNGATAELKRRVDELERNAVMAASFTHWARAVEELQRAAPIVVETEKRTDALEKDVAPMKSKMSTAEKLAITAIIAALGSIGAVVTKISDRSERAGEERNERQHLKEDVAELKRLLNLSPSWQLPAKKD